MCWTEVLLSVHHHSTSPHKGNPQGSVKAIGGVLGLSCKEELMINSTEAPLTVSVGDVVPPQRTALEGLQALGPKGGPKVQG